MKRIVLFASGSGTNAERIVTYFQNNPDVTIVALFCNNPKAYVLERMAKLNVPTHLFSKADFTDNGLIHHQLREMKADLIVLAGFLWRMPDAIVHEFSDQIINIHPALLPKYGGKGMYGHHVHEAVIAARETESGITVHYVNEIYDSGAIIMQARCTLAPTDSVPDLEAKIHQLEQLYFPIAIAQVLNLPQ